METRNDVNRNQLAFSPSRALYISMSAATIFTTGTMAVGFLLCIGLALLVNYKSSIATHCRVPNFLPSISAAIALPPSCYIWRLSVMLTTVQRLLAIRYHHMQYAGVKTSRAWYPVLCNACAMAELLENLSLIALTCVSSTENTDLHENFFISFQVCATVFMILMCLVYKTACGSHPSAWERKSLRAKYICLVVNIICFLIAVACYMTHRYYCKPYAYTVFSFFEYIVVLTNILYHGFVTYDFADVVIEISLPSKKD
ncbi:post-GPI attachment to proteins factor 2-like [Patiria miniata]|uniref:CWH43-like N-terminal domain-containing protein n=1 Tax=Patiria miniata TaxID=46514 RepID=A0A913ZUR4_PATMI|nr:post-GPI attachment to proteins factor 2-like [Patiria miniata]XP_038055302.1 post-GPI attachment to proteins factor 2-like [Patiria miniata]